MNRENKIQKLNHSLHFLKMDQLRNTCNQLGIPHSGKKAEIIDRITTFCQSGTPSASTQIPDISKAKKENEYPLSPETKILFGNYKNDLRTRNFLKKLIGEHFHFTAFGQDWIKERWRRGNPPTYREFAKYWAEETQKRKKRPAPPKKEWAYINFIQRYLKEHPKATRSEIVKNWNEERQMHVNIVRDLLKEMLNYRKSSITLGTN